MDIELYKDALEESNIEAPKNCFGTSFIITFLLEQLHFAGPIYEAVQIIHKTHHLALSEKKGTPSLE